MTTNKNVLIRDEEHADILDISRVTAAAFDTQEHSSGTEQFIIKALRAANALTISLVADVGKHVVGHIAFSPVVMSDGTKDWYGLGPVSVLPKDQQQGIGKALIKEGLARLRKLEAKGCCLVGHPEYYRQFGFKNVEGLVYEDIPQEFFFVLSYDGAVPGGKVTYHDGFNASS